MPKTINKKEYEQNDDVKTSINQQFIKIKIFGICTVIISNLPNLFRF